MNAAAKGASVRRRLFRATSPCAWWRRIQRPSQRITGVATADRSSICPAPDTTIGPNVEMETVSCAAPAVTVSRCVTVDGRFPGTPAAVIETENDGLASADEGSTQIRNAASARRRSMAQLDHRAPPVGAGARRPTRYAMNHFPEWSDV